MTAWAELCTGLLGGRPGRSVPVLGLALSLVLGFASPLLALDDEPSTTVGGSYGFASLCPPKEQSRVAQHDPNLAPRLEAVQSASPEGGPSNGAASKGADALIIQYDAFNRIDHVDRSFDGGASFRSVADYTYFADGRRATKKATVYDPVSAQLVRQDNLAFINDGAREIEEVDLGSGLVVANYIWGASDIDELRVFQNSNGRFSVFGDRQMTSLLVCDFNTALPVERYSYTNEYGRCQVMSPGTLDTTGGGNNVLGSPISVAQEVRCPFRFQGRRFDDESGLYFFRSRYMDPVEGRFVTRDPAGIWHDAANRGNGYAFEGGNPTSRRDPFGLDDSPRVAAARANAQPESVTGAFVSGFFGYFADRARYQHQHPHAEAEAAVARADAVATALVAGNPNASTPSLFVQGSLVLISDATGGTAGYQAITSNSADNQGLTTGNLRILSTTERVESGVECGIKVIVTVVAVDSLFDSAGTEGGGQTVERPGTGSSDAPGMGDPTTPKCRGGTCFLAGTLVLTREGLTPIENVRTGDEVLSRDETTGRQEFRKVSSEIHGETQWVCSVTIVPSRSRVKSGASKGDGAADEDGPAENTDPPSQTIQCTRAHRFYVLGRGWVHAATLKPGDRVHTASSNSVVVQSVTIRLERAKTFNFEVEGLHTHFVAGKPGAPGIWVHNGDTDKQIDKLQGEIDKLNEMHADAKESLDKLMEGYSRPDTGHGERTLSHDPGHEKAYKEIQQQAEDLRTRITDIEEQIQIRETEIKQLGGC